MPPLSASSGRGLPAGRTGHACAQCRHRLASYSSRIAVKNRRLTKHIRKQKCGGLTYGIKCRPCTTRLVKCSFQDEVMDLRHNPYLGIASPNMAYRSTEITDVDEPAASSNSAALIPVLSALGKAGGAASFSEQQAGDESTSTNPVISAHLEVLTQRFV